MADIKNWAALIRGRWDWTRFRYEEGFPGGCQFTDIDATTEFAGRFLVIEPKHHDGTGPMPYPDTGQLILLRKEVRFGKAVIVLYGCGVCNSPQGIRVLGESRQGDRWEDWRGRDIEVRRKLLKHEIDQAMGLGSTRLPRRQDYMTVGHDLYREVVNFAPDDLSPGELVVAWVIADDARDATRVSWISNAELCRRSRMKPSGVRAALGRRAARRFEFRAIHGYRKDGRPVFAAKGHAADYLVPDMLKGAVSAAPLAAGGARKGAVVAHKGAVTAAPIGPKGAVVTAPLPSEDLNPLRQPSDDGPDLTPAVEGARASRQVNSSNVSEHEQQHNALTRWEQSARGMTPIEAAAWNAIHPDGKQ